MKITLEIRNKTELSKGIPVIKALRQFGSYSLVDAKDMMERMSSIDTKNPANYIKLSVDTERHPVKEIVHVMNDARLNYRLYDLVGKEFSLGITNPKEGIVDLVDLIIDVPISIKLDIAKKSKAPEWFMVYIKEIDNWKKVNRSPKSEVVVSKKAAKKK